MPHLMRGRYAMQGGRGPFLQRAVFVASCMEPDEEGDGVLSHAVPAAPLGAYWLWSTPLSRQAGRVGRSTLIMLRVQGQSEIPAPCDGGALPAGRPLRTRRSYATHGSFRDLP